MAETSDILEKADELGELISSHDSAKEMEASQKALTNDAGAIQATQQFEHFAMELARKQQMGQQITPQDRAQLEQMQMAVVSNPMLGRYQTAQMNYLDLLRKVHEKIIGADETAAAAMGQQEQAQGGAPGGGMFGM